MNTITSELNLKTMRLGFKKAFFKIINMSRFLCFEVKIGVLISKVKKLNYRASTGLFYNVLLEKQTNSSSLASKN